MLELLEGGVFTWASVSSCAFGGVRDSRMATPSKERRFVLDQGVLRHSLSRGPVLVEDELDAGCSVPYLRLELVAVSCLRWDAARTLAEMNAPALSSMHSRRRRMSSASSCCWLSMTSQMPGLLSAMVIDW